MTVDVDGGRRWVQARRTRAFVVVLVSAAALACTGLTEAGERVRVVEDPGEVHGCRFLREVEGSAMHTKPGQWVGGNALIAETSAENDARNEAGALGADTLLDLDTDLGAFEATAQAGAYRCQE